MEKTAIQAGKIAGTFAGRRWRIWEWVNGKIDRKLTERKPVQISSMQGLWNKIFSRELVDGDYILISKSNDMSEAWYLSEWVPKAPGQIWQSDSLMRLTPDQIATGFRTSLANFYRLPEEVRHCFVDYSLTEHSHWEMQYRSGQGLVRQGFGYRLGVYRPPLNASEDNHYALLSMCSGKEYMIDMGFPVVVSKEVYRKFLESSKLENAVEFEAVIKIRDIGLSDSFNRYIKTSGSKYDEAFSDLIGSPLHSSNLIGELISPLDINTKINGTHPFMTLRVDGYNSDEETQRNIPAISRFIVLNPAKRDARERASGYERDRRRYSLDFLLDADYQFGTTMNPATDFDGRSCLYQCELPVADNPAISKNS